MQFTLTHLQIQGKCKNASAKIQRDHMKWRCDIYRVVQFYMCHFCVTCQK
jgi:hypothetical protein